MNFQSYLHVLPYQISLLFSPRFVPLFNSSQVNHCIYHANTDDSYPFMHSRKQMPQKNSNQIKPSQLILSPYVIHQFHPSAPIRHSLIASIAQ
ncbi:hypothetical protein BCIN_10g05790 [Botrytis cinerea B05.10]|uniref:Uncharacterized protein n=1 Tax=Botryotinia fuckeliana (strain B05.10) TaxID=332648 RepID=A0A384JVL9_BOTFB|nr:hypothetical protein BCIN_10g05790 [Botrytis cinerea B05.10]ATZ54588.1 hypothetical protein BCIN_10g05790 [Botrytis cinerea B05.10]